MSLSKLSEKGLLTPDNCVVALIDHQPQMLFGTSNFDRQGIINNTVALAVILSETNTLVVDESWLKGESGESSQRRGLSALADREVEMIEAALAETGGRISGPTGAAAKLGIPRQTLESKIRRLRINKYQHKRSAS
jgi:DNA-binding NtrC family response regulator